MFSAFHVQHDVQDAPLAVFIFLESYRNVAASSGVGGAWGRRFHDVFEGALKVR
jgi:hypothetical protein